MQRGQRLLLRGVRARGHGRARPGVGGPEDEGQFEAVAGAERGAVGRPVEPVGPRLAARGGHRPGEGVGRCGEGAFGDDVHQHVHRGRARPPRPPPRLRASRGVDEALDLVARRVRGRGARDHRPRFVAGGADDHRDARGHRAVRGVRHERARCVKAVDDREEGWRHTAEDRGLAGDPAGGVEQPLDGFAAQPRAQRIGGESGVAERRVEQGGVVLGLAGGQRRDPTGRALQDRAVEEAARLGHGQHELGGVGARRLTEDGDVVRVAAERGDGVVHPAERLDHVAEPGVAVAGALDAQVAQRDPAGS